MEISAHFTGKYPNLCSGQWLITIDGTLLTNDDTERYGDGILFNHMDTNGTYQSWSFDENWSESFDSYETGDCREDWYSSETAARLYNLCLDNGIIMTDTDMEQLYIELQANDWRSSSCGGCI